MSKIRRHKTKVAAVAHLGGKCAECGYDENIIGLEFHHISGTKEFNIGKMGNRKWSLVLKELEKCVLLCSVCHRIAHSDREDPRFLSAVAAYRPYREDGNTGTTVEPNRCVCGQAISSASRSCKACFRRPTKIAWPPTDKLLEMVELTSFTAVASQLGVSGNAVRKRLKRHAATGD